MQFLGKYFISSLSYVVLGLYSRLVKIMIYESSFMDKYLDISSRIIFFLFKYLWLRFPFFHLFASLISFYYKTIIKKCSWKIKKKYKNNFYWRGCS